MSTFVLVHGSGQNAACWQRVAAALHERGHRVVAPELPKTASDLGLREHAALVARAVPDPDTVVVAHSLCGALLPLLPAMVPCRHLVFLAAVIPEPGRSVRQQFAADPTMFHPQWIAAGARWRDPAELRGLSREFLFHDCDPETEAWAQTTVQAIDSQRIITEPCPLTAWPATPMQAVVATFDRTLTPGWCRRQACQRLGLAPLEMPTGHSPMCSQPRELAVLLAALAA